MQNSVADPSARHPSTRAGERQEEPLELEAQGHVFRLRRRGLAQRGGGKRGKVRGISDASRHRLLEKMGRIKHDPKRCLFITLTYPAEYPSDAQAKDHLEALFKRIRSRYPRAAWYWRIEAQARGAPHFHLLLFNIRYLPVERLRALWKTSAGIPDGQTCRIGIERVRSWRGVIHYAAKYIAKREEGRGGVAPVSSSVSHISEQPRSTDGRAWGVMGGENVPMAELHRCTLRMGAWFYDLKHLAAGVWWPAGEGAEGFMLFCDDPLLWLDTARSLDVASPWVYAA